MLEKVFKLKENNTNLCTELLAGLTTFMAAAYIIVVNPGIISGIEKALPGKGMPMDGVMIATIFSTAVATLLMGLLANYPFVLAPGMGLSAYFTHSVVLHMGYSWQVALGAVFISGVVFLILSLVRIREMIIDSVPQSIRYAITAGIGLFIAFIGLKNAGIIVAAEEPAFVALGDLSKGSTFLAMLGLIITGVLVALKVKGAILIGIIVTTLIGALPFFSITQPPSGIVAMPNWSEFGEVFMKLDIMGALNIGFLNIIFSFLFVDMFDTVGTLIGISEKAGLLRNGRLERATPALLSDSLGTVVGAGFGTPTVTTYVESAAGVAYGGRTGLTAVTVAVLFLLSLIFIPLIRVIPQAATTPALVVVGVMMMGSITRINWDDLTEALPAFMAMIVMPFTFSIANGIALAYILFPLIKLFTGRGRSVHILAYILCILFILKFIYVGV